eukprot:1150776-Pelagomonas_calceolata.AAC.3
MQPTIATVKCESAGRHKGQQSQHVLGPYTLCAAQSLRPLSICSMFSCPCVHNPALPSLRHELVHQRLCRATKCLLAIERNIVRLVALSSRLPQARGHAEPTRGKGNLATNRDAVRPRPPAHVTHALHTPATTYAFLAIDNNTHPHLLLFNGCMHHTLTCFSMATCTTPPPSALQWLHISLNIDKTPSLPPYHSHPPYHQQTHPHLLLFSGHMHPLD